VGTVVGTWWLQRSTRATAADDPTPAASEAVTAPGTGGPVADVGTDQPAVVQPTEIEKAVEPEVEPATEEVEPEPPAKRAASRRRRGRRAGSVSVSAPVTEPVSGAAPVTEPGAATEGGASESPEEDEGIDWTLPGFPEEGAGDEGRAPQDPPRAEPAPPTGTPDTPPRNPVVIDEVPEDGS